MTSTNGRLLTLWPALVSRRLLDPATVQVSPRQHVDTLSASTFTLSSYSPPSPSPSLFFSPSLTSGGGCSFRQGSYSRKLGLPPPIPIVA